MKKLAVLLLALAGTFTLHAQLAVGLQAGPQMTTARYDITAKKQDASFRYGFQAGAFLKVPFEGRLYFAPAANYSLKGYKVNLAIPSFPPDPLAVKNDVQLHTFELAALLQVDFGSQNQGFYIKFGPALDFQLFGKEKFTKATGETVNRSMKFGMANYGRYGASGIGQIGYTTQSGWMIAAQYTYGLTSMNNADGGPLVRHRVAGISIGKLLKAKKIVMDTRVKE